MSAASQLPHGAVIHMVSAEGSPFCPVEAMLPRHSDGVVPLGVPLAGRNTLAMQNTITKVIVAQDAARNTHPATVIWDICSSGIVYRLRSETSGVSH